MRQKNRLLIFIMLFAFLLFGIETLKACSCAEKPTVLEDYEGSEDVIIAEITGVEKITDENEMFYNSTGIKGAKMSVKKVFKGKLKEDGEVFFQAGNGVDCGVTFNEKDIGIKMLIYSTPYEGRRAISFCGRSTNLEAAKDDLKYLENIDKVRGKTRISGTVAFGVREEYHPGLNAQGKKIRIIGKTKTFTAVTDKDGFYEIYDVPAGEYFIEPETPLGWKINRYWLEYSPSVEPYYRANTKFPNRFFMLLEPNRHASVNFKYEIDNSIQGRLLYPDGKPIKNTCVYAIRTDDPDASRMGNPGCTNDRGIFKITEMYDKSYVLVINGDGKISGRTPIKTLFYPGVNDRAKATVINMTAGKKITVGDFRVPKLEETITLRGVLTYSDGTLLTQGQSVYFVADVENENIEKKPYVYSEKTGQFEIKIIKGQKGKLFSRMVVGPRTFEACPDVKKVATKDNYVYTQEIKIDGDKDIINIKLVFPFLKCNKD